MQHNETVSFLMLCQLYDTPTFKTKALRLVTTEGRVAKMSFATI